MEEQEQSHTKYSLLQIVSLIYVSLVDLTEIIFFVSGKEIKTGENQVWLYSEL